MYASIYKYMTYGIFCTQAHVLRSHLLPWLQAPCVSAMAGAQQTGIIYVYVCIYFMYIDKHIHTSRHIHAYIHAYTHMCVYAHIRHIWLSTTKRHQACLGMLVYVSACAPVRTHVCITILHMYMHTYMQYSYTSSRHQFKMTGPCMSRHVCVCVCVCACVCVCVCIRNGCMSHQHT